MSNTNAFPPLSEVTSDVVTTEAAAYYLNRKSQTLRGWACLKSGPLQPVRICGRLGWRVRDLRALLGG